MHSYTKHNPPFPIPSHPSPPHPLPRCEQNHKHLYEHNHKIKHQTIKLKNSKPYVNKRAILPHTGTVVINFDEIGFKENLPVPGSQGKLICLVQSIGATKSLVISPEGSSMVRELTYSTELIGKQLLCLREVTDGLQVR